MIVILLIKLLLQLADIEKISSRKTKTK
jgi:hypothetical protein